MQSYPEEGTLIVELNRTSGDPVLFVKPHDQGFARYGLPSVHDFDHYADTSSYEDRLDYHSIILQHARQASDITGAVLAAHCLRPCNTVW